MSGRYFMSANVPANNLHLVNVEIYGYDLKGSQIDHFDLNKDFITLMRLSIADEGDIPKTLVKCKVICLELKREFNLDLLAKFP